MSVFSIIDRIRAGNLHVSDHDDDADNLNLNGRGNPVYSYQAPADIPRKEFPGVNLAEEFTKERAQRHHQEVAPTPLTISKTTGSPAKGTSKPPPAVRIRIEAPPK